MTTLKGMGVKVYGFCLMTNHKEKGTFIFSNWVPTRGSYLFSVRALSRHFRGRMVSALRSAAKTGELTGIDPGAVSALLDALMGEDWVVFGKPCLEHTKSLIGYLARYTYRIVISNARIECVDAD